VRGGWVSPPLAAALLAAVLFSQTLVAMVPAEAKKKLPLLFNVKEQWQPTTIWI